MANGILHAQQGKPPRRGRPSTGAPGAAPAPHLGWIPVALGAAAVVARLGGRRHGAMALALTAVAGAGAVSALRGGQLDPNKAARARQSAEPVVERALTIGKPADVLRTSWQDPRTLPQIMAGFAGVRSTGEGRMHWKLEGPLGRVLEWDTEAVDRPGEGIGWRSLPGAAIPNDGLIRFQPGPADRGTVATLRVRFDQPGGALAGEVLDLFGNTPLNLLVEGVLRRFKSLVETGEIPTTARQPAARAETY